MRPFMYFVECYLRALDERKELAADRVGGVNVTNGQRKPSIESRGDFVYPGTDHLTKALIDLERYFRALQKGKEKTKNL